MPETAPTVLVLTALALEYRAVRDHITDREEVVHHDGTRAERGRLPKDEHGRPSDTDWHVALAELGEGTRTAAALTTQLITWLKPEAVLFVGVAGSLKEDIGIGDVVIGTKVYGIHGGKQTPTGFLVRPEAWPVSNALVNAARSAVRDMADVRAHFKPIASGDVVLVDAESEIARHLREHYNDAGAIEMEGSGAAQAAHLNGRLDALVVRGISDRADADKSTADARGSQELAARQAASVAMAILRKHRSREGSADSEERPHGRGDGAGAIEMEGSGAAQAAHLNGKTDRRR